MYSLDYGGVFNFLREYEIGQAKETGLSKETADLIREICNVEFNADKKTNSENPIYPSFSIRQEMTDAYVKMRKRELDRFFDANFYKELTYSEKDELLEEHIASAFAFVYRKFQWMCSQLFVFYKQETITEVKSVFMKPNLTLIQYVHLLNDFERKHNDIFSVNEKDEHRRIRYMLDEKKREHDFSYEMQSVFDNKLKAELAEQKTTDFKNEQKKQYDFSYKYCGRFNAYEKALIIKKLSDAKNFAEYKILLDNLLVVARTGGKVEAAFGE